MAIFAYNDCVGVDIIDLCDELDLLVPEQVAVLGVDNDEIICEASRIPLSSICFDIEHLAYQAAAFLDQIMQGGCEETQRRVHAGSGTVTRLSTNIVAVDNVHVAKALLYIMKNITDPVLNVAAVAEHAGISERGLRKAFAKHMGRSVYTEIAKLRDEKAREMLTTTRLSVKQIAAATGFSSANYMARFFRRLHGMSPKEYRKNT